MLITVKQVAERLTVSRATVWRYVAKKSDFPQPIKLSPGCSRWRDDEIEQWMEIRDLERASA